ncbi:MAG: Holliday junction branch migration protein RuvA [Ignavibacteria bacterium]|jgi:Holliday junction DNA helicase RuvA|nr:Holliday junction branch migration protein RuvA [Ignavibacteria bacterium]MCU7503503.1 Holliday junction branch migration protein RuvA [Ignavibacteria bacterium]MCU7517249.1 Holliday junction branch migration protein RuvA [Ignavibacteria bacterium]
MIGHLTGKILAKKPTQVLLDVAGVGYVVNISINTFEKLGDEGQAASVHTYLAVREDALSLYGFSTESEKQMFELLISINGIGPKLAQGILSGIQIDELKHALKSGNLSRLVAVPGVGRKTAERMLLDLRDKVDTVAGEKEAPLLASFKIKDDAIAALTTLGYNQKNAEKVIRDILTEEPSMALEDLIRQALSHLNK